jgi:membrane-bound metal-dependent hydrolase YbcI (DUF457 family)
MFPLAHLGIGSAMTRLLPAKLQFRWVLAGTLLPDLIDKPAFLLLRDPGKRGFAHTLLFLALLAAISGWRRSQTLWSVTAGTATHLVLDMASKSTAGMATNAGSLQVLFWPLLGWSFPTLSHGMHGVEIWSFEAAGLALLLVQLGVRRFRPASA